MLTVPSVVDVDLFRSVHSSVVDADLGEGREPGACSLSVMRASQVLSQAWECGHAVAVSLKLGDLGVRSLGLALCDLVRVLELLKENEVSDAHVVTAQELSIVGEKFANTSFEGTQRSFVDLLSCCSFGKDKLD